ncbi:hypothetical protein [Actinoplanes sp. L3-i22]|uniref:hypothetical protein n=1 Tax=Actinoplanes sp. L3-i22 TaxID=2836373 RepID=UPI001C7867B1|nr:hypothetical protein [Actinoplanes sp. L3-i22]BCY10968.1 hypothetical protein L3i22_060560 [Actinoplanes sp. L3-i22]
MTTTHIATIGTAPDVVAGDHCDLRIFPAGTEIAGNLDGDETTDVYIISGDQMYVTDLSVEIGGDDEQAMAEADQILETRGMTRVGPWEPSDNALYAEVEASIDDQFSELMTAAAVLELAMNRRDLLVRSLMLEPPDIAPRTRIASAARLKEARLYQIRDGRR